jgi:hypothetical protein
MVPGPQDGGGAKARGGVNGAEPAIGNPYGFGLKKQPRPAPRSTPLFRASEGTPI